ncbi:hypothetical protein CEXT_221001 [Caerostris extrusa]|uniref:Uncharacterized protein n=1 Tax=Caerostris extrusa TaxID=172846 RepID=A0AAV4N673_CAEEX|nr:hypothetical protein CEXT_221001 [Caerostris extrusa]
MITTPWGKGDIFHRKIFLTSNTVSNGGKIRIKSGQYVPCLATHHPSTDETKAFDQPAFISIHVTPIVISISQLPSFTRDRSRAYHVDFLQKGTH